MQWHRATATRRGLLACTAACVAIATSACAPDDDDAPEETADTTLDEAWRLVVTGSAQMNQVARTYSARLDDDGDPVTWEVDDDSLAFGDSGLASRDGCVVVAAGARPGSTFGTSEVVASAPVDRDGIGRWMLQPFLPQELAGNTLIATEDTVFSVGGMISPYRGPNVFVAELDEDCGVGEWRVLAAVPGHVAGMAFAASDGRLWRSGGGANTSYSPQVASAALGPWTLGSWSDATPLPEGRYDHRMVAADGRLFVLGGAVEGFDGYAELTAEVLVADIGADGTASAWRTTTPLPEPLVRVGAVVHDDHVYVVSGAGDKPGPARVWRAQLTDAGLGPFRPLQSLPEGMADARLAMVRVEP